MANIIWYVEVLHPFGVSQRGPTASMPTSQVFVTVKIKKSTPGHILLFNDWVWNFGWYMCVSMVSSNQMHFTCCAHTYVHKPGFLPGHIISKMFYTY